MDALKTVVLGIPLFIVFIAWAISYAVQEILSWALGQLLCAMPCDSAKRASKKFNT